MARAHRHRAAATGALDRRPELEPVDLTITHFCFDARSFLFWRSLIFDSTLAHFFTRGRFDGSPFFYMSPLRRELARAPRPGPGLRRVDTRAGSAPPAPSLKGFCVPPCVHERPGLAPGGFFCPAPSP